MALDTCGGCSCSSMPMSPPGLHSSNLYRQTWGLRDPPVGPLQTEWALPTPSPVERRGLCASYVLADTILPSPRCQLATYNCPHLWAEE